MGLKEVKASWEAMGEEDPLYGVLSHPDKRGGAWDTEDFFATGEAEIAQLMEQLRVRAPKMPLNRALDFGCGVGRLSQALATRFAKVVAVDVASSMLEQARKHDKSAGKIQWVLNDAPDLAFQRTGSVDLVYSHIVLQHLPPDLALGYITEFMRVLSPQGWAVFQVPTESEDPEWRVKVRNSLPSALVGAYRKLRYGSSLPTIEMNGIHPEKVFKTVSKAGGQAMALEGGWYWAQRIKSEEIPFNAPE